MRKPVRLLLPAGPIARQLLTAKCLLDGVFPRQLVAITYLDAPSSGAVQLVAVWSGFQCLSGVVAALAVHVQHRHAVGFQHGGQLPLTC